MIPEYSAERIFNPTPHSVFSPSSSCVHTNSHTRPITHAFTHTHTHTHAHAHAHTHTHTSADAHFHGHTHAQAHSHSKMLSSPSSSATASTPTSCCPSSTAHLIHPDKILNNNIYWENENYCENECECECECESETERDLMCMDTDLRDKCVNVVQHEAPDSSNKRKYGYENEIRTRIECQQYDIKRQKDNSSHIDSCPDVSLTPTAQLKSTCQCHQRFKFLPPTMSPMDIKGPCDTEPESDLSIHEPAQYQKLVLTALADLQLGKRGGWTNTEMGILVREYNATCGQRGLMHNVYTSLQKHSGRSKRSIQRLLNSIRSATQCP